MDRANGKRRRKEDFVDLCLKSGTDIALTKQRRVSAEELNSKDICDAFDPGRRKRWLCLDEEEEDTANGEFDLSFYK